MANPQFRAAAAKTAGLRLREERRPQIVGRFPGELVPPLQCQYGVGDYGRLQIEVQGWADSTVADVHVVAVAVDVAPIFAVVLALLFGLPVPSSPSQPAPLGRLCPPPWLTPRHCTTPSAMPSATIIASFSRVTHSSTRYEWARPAAAHRSGSGLPSSSR